MHKIHLLFFAFTINLCLTSKAQNNNFKQWLVKDGLPQSNIYCVKQDQRGYLWIGTGGGLCSFDGKKFKIYSKKEGLIGNVVRSILEDSKGLLWFGTDEGLSVYNGKLFKNISKKNGLYGTTVLCLLENYRKDILAGTDDGGLNDIKIISPDSIIISVYDVSKGMSNNFVFDLLEDKEKNLWAATFGGINIFHPNKYNYSIKVINGRDNLPSDMLLSISKDDNENLWFGTYNAGAFQLNTGKSNQLPEISYKTFNGLDRNAVWDILYTSSKNIWFGTSDNGITRFIPKSKSSKFKIETYTTKQGLSGNQILCLFEDKERNIWIGTNGDGLCMSTGDYFSHYTVKDGLSNSKIQAIDQDADGNYWLATDGGGITIMNFFEENAVFKIYTKKDGLISNSISSIAIGKAANQNIWIGTTNKGIVKFDGKNFINYNERNGLVNDRVNCMVVDSKGILWCGTANGISRFDGVNFVNVNTESMKMNDEGVKSIIEDKKGMLWFGSAGGLARYNGKSTLRTFDEAEGLKNKNVNVITEDDKGNIWIGTNDGGIYKFNSDKPDTTAIEFVADDKKISSNSIRSLKFINKTTLLVGTFNGFDKLTIDNSGKIIKTRNYNYSDGFTGIECNDNAIYKDKQNIVWIGTVNGLTRYNMQAEKRNLPLPEVHLTGLQLFYQNIDWSSKADTILPWFNLPKNLKLAYTDNNLTFQFSAISLTNPDKLRYKYILEGRDDNWSPAKEVKEVTYSGLVKGNYVFKVMALDANGNWSDPAVFAFSILLPWYQTNQFYILIIILVIGLIYGFIKIRENKLQREKRILEEKVAIRTAQVVKQKEEIIEQKEQIEERNFELNQQNEEIAAQRDEIEHQKHLVDEHQKEIIDSINYAKRIQNAILPPLYEIAKSLPSSFVLYKPKDIVAGDFYWYNVVNNEDIQNSGYSIIFIAAADCTGHGVPGAMLSVVCCQALNRAVIEFELTETGEILDKVTDLVIDTFEKSGEEIKDGMDISLLAIHKIKNMNGEENIINLQWSGANNPLWYTPNPIVIDSKIEQDSEQIFVEVKADKQPIGRTDRRKPFTTHTFDYKPNSRFILMTDGYADQFGGPDEEARSTGGKKFKYKQLQNIIINNLQESPAMQKEALVQAFNSWKGNLDQIDDVTIIGIKI